MFTKRRVKYILLLAVSTLIFYYLSRLTENLTPSGEVKVEKGGKFGVPPEAAEFHGLDENNEKLIKFTKDFLIQPSNLSYNLENPTKNDPSFENMAETVWMLLKNKSNGFFVECGALDGEESSDTLMLERFHGWTGLLVEASYINSEKLLSKNRKAWIAPCCMSLSKKSELVTYYDDWAFGKVAGAENMTWHAVEHGSLAKGFCIPFHTMMSALNRTKIDFFSLDVQGTELEILMTIDFSRIQIDVMSIAHHRAGDKVTKILDLMAAHGFRLEAKAQFDFIFVSQRLVN